MLLEVRRGRPNSTQRETTLAALQRDIDSASPAAGASGGGTGPALKQSHLARHRQVLVQHRADQSRLSSQTREARNRASLLAGVRRDVREYRAADPAAQEAEYMLQERGRLDRSNTMADGLLSQAYATNEAFGVQREQLDRVRVRALQAAGQIPGMNGLIQRISNRKKRDGYILGSFIAVCFLMVWLFS